MKKTTNSVTFQCNLDNEKQEKEPQVFWLQVTCVGLCWFSAGGTTSQTHTLSRRDPAHPSTRNL